MGVQLEEIAEKINRDFSNLDIEKVQKRYNLRKVSVYGDVIYVCSKQDEWYIKRNECGQIRLWHRNTWKKQSEYHKEHMNFKGVFEILEYIKHHDKKIYGLGHRGVYTKTHIEELFDVISQQQKQQTIGTLKV